MADDRGVMRAELTVGGRVRGFIIRLPRDADGEIPLALVLHGDHPDAGGWVVRERSAEDQARCRPGSRRGARVTGGCRVIAQLRRAGPRLRGSMRGTVA